MAWTTAQGKRLPDCRGTARQGRISSRRRRFGLSPEMRQKLEGVGQRAAMLPKRERDWVPRKYLVVSSEVVVVSPRRDRDGSATLAVSTAQPLAGQVAIVPATDTTPSALGRLMASLGLRELGSLVGIRRRS